MAADERATITIDVDVKNLNRLQQVTAALEAMGIASDVNAAKFSNLTGAMTGHSRASNKASKDSQKLYEKISMLDKVSMLFTKQARKLMLGVMAMSFEFAASALTLASVNALFVIGKVLVKGYQLAMQGLSAGLAAVGVAAIAAAAAFSEMQTAQFAFRYSSDSTTTAMDKSSLALRGLYKDTQLNIYGIKALSAAFAGVSKNAKFTGESQKMLQGFSDFIASSGDPTKAMQAAANAIGLIQKKQTGSSKQMSAEAMNAIKQINPALADLAKKGGGGFGNKEKFIAALLDGSLAEKSGVSGAADNVAGTLFAQFKSYLTSGFVELADVGKRVLEPVKKTMHAIFTSLTKNFRRISSDLVAFGQGPLLKSLVTVVDKMGDFSVTLFRKYLPATEGFAKKIGSVFFQLKSYFYQVTTTLDKMRDGGSIVIQTFGKPILEIFKQIGKSAQNIGELATKHRESFLKFGDALKGIVVGFFDLSKTFKEAFTGALPVITTVLNAIAKIVSMVNKVFGMLTGSNNPLGSAVGMFAMGSMALKGTRAAQRKARNSGSGGGIPGYTEVSELDWAARGIPMPSNASGAAAAAGGGTSLSGAMSMMGGAASEALTTSLAPGIGVVTGASSTAAAALSSLASAATATGASLRGGMTGGRVGVDGNIKTPPTRKAGQSRADYKRDMTAWRMQNKGDDLRGLEYTGPLGMPSKRAASDPYAYGGLPGPYMPGLAKQRYKASRFDINKKADAFAALKGYDTTGSALEKFKASISNWSSPEFLESAASQRLSPMQKLMSRGRSSRIANQTRATKAFLQPANLAAQASSLWNGSGVTGAMTGQSAAGSGGRVINPGPGSVKAIGLKGKLDYYGGKAVFGQGYAGGTFGTETKNLLTGKNFRKRYNASLANQQAALAKMHPEAAAAGVQMKGSRFKAAKAATKGNFSGLGGIAAMGLSAGASKFGSDEAQGALQMGAGMMTTNPLLGLGIAGVGTALSAKTKVGGLMAGAAGGAAIGMMVGGPLGAAVGGLIGAGLGFFSAKKNQRKMVEKAVKKIGDQQLAGIAAKAVEGALIGTTNLARKKMLDTSKLAESFRGAKTEEERKKVLSQYSTGPNAILTGNAASLAVGDNYADTQKALDKNVTDQKALTPMFNRFDGVMKALGGTTKMTAAEIFDLAMRKNVDLYDSTQSLSDITTKLGVGMVKTAQQMRDAFKDIRIGAQGVYQEYKKGKEITDSLQGAGNTLRGGNNSADAMADYLNKFGDFLDYKNPKSPVSNIVATLRAFGSGKAFGTGTFFQTGGVLSGVTQTGAAQTQGAEYTSQLKIGAANEMANQLGAQLLAQNVQGVDPTMVREQIKGRVLNLMSTVQTGDAAGATQEQKDAATTASAQIKKLEALVMDPTAFQGKNAGEITNVLNNALYGGEGPFGKGMLALENVAKDIIEVKLDRSQLEKDFSAAVIAGFAASIDAPQWWNTAPNWWDNVKWNGKEFYVDSDTRSPRRDLVGDTSTPKALGATMGAHNAMDSKLTGKRSVTSSFRTTGLGSPSSDHAAGRAYDLTGQNLGQYASLAKSAGGFAEFHGAASTRHLHVVPSLARSGDTSSPMSSTMSPTGATYNGGDISITIVESKDAKATAREVAKEIIAMQKNERRRM